MNNKTFKKNAVLDENGNYRHFGIHPVTASLYGDKVEDIVELTMKISDNQSEPDNETMIADYWGWFDNEENEFSLIYPKYFLLNMCFPYGIKILEAQGRGKAYRLEIIEYDKTN